MTVVVMQSPEESMVLLSSAVDKQPWSLQGPPLPAKPVAHSRPATTSPIRFVRYKETVFTAPLYTKLAGHSQKIGGIIGHPQVVSKRPPDGFWQVHNNWDLFLYR